MTSEQGGIVYTGTEDYYGMYYIIYNLITYLIYYNNAIR